MSLSYTTLSAAITSSDTSFAMAAVTSITVPNFTTGVGIYLLWCEGEQMLVTNVDTTNKIVTVKRGYNGTCAVSHAASAAVAYGVGTDFVGEPVARKDYFPNNYGTPPVALRAAAAQATSLVATASSADITSDVKAAIIEIMNTLIAVGLWKGGA